MKQLTFDEITGAWVERQRIAKAIRRRALELRHMRPPRNGTAVELECIADEIEADDVNAIGSGESGENG